MNTAMDHPVSESPHIKTVENSCHVQTGDYVLTVARTVQDLEKLRAFWESCQSHPNSDIDLVLLILASRKEIERPHVILISSAGRPMALLVGRIENTSQRLALGYETGVKLKVKSLTFVTGGLLGSLPDAALPQLFSHLKTELRAGGVDRVSFSNLPIDSSLFRALARNARWLCRDRVWEAHLHWTMNVPAETGGLLKRMSKKHRYWIRRLEKKLNEAFPGVVSYKSFADGSAIPRLCEEVEKVARRTYLRGMGQGFTYNEETLKRFELEAAHNRLRAYVLYLHGQPKAFWIGITYEGVFHAGYTGYDPDLRDHELGTLLFVFMVDQLAAEGVKKFDFGLGDALYKQRFGDESWQEVTYSLYARSPKGLALAVLGTAHVILSRFARWLLARLGVFYRLKKYWRKRLIKPEQETES